MISQDASSLELANKPKRGSRYSMRVLRAFLLCDPIYSNSLNSTGNRHGWQNRTSSIALHACFFCRALEDSKIVPKRPCSFTEWHSQPHKNNLRFVCPECMSIYIMELPLGRNQTIKRSKTYPKCIIFFYDNVLHVASYACTYGPSLGISILYVGAYFESSFFIIVSFSTARKCCI